VRAVVQRVSQAGVTVQGEQVAQIGHGLLVLLGVCGGDTDAEAEYIADKIAGLRIFDDQSGRMNRSVTDCGGAVLLVSQFTLYGDCRRGRRPSFTQAAAPQEAERLYQAVAQRLRAPGLEVQTGRFGAEMAVSLVNDGPVTLLIDSERVL
jgi:D-tyrosyl-tRNA(Tyr) deacylase